MSGRQDVAGEAAALAQHMVFALGERSNMGAILPSLLTILPGASLEHMGSGQPQSETAGLYLHLLKILCGRIHRMVCTFIAQGLTPAHLRSWSGMSPFGSLDLKSLTVGHYPWFTQRYKSRVRRQIPQPAKPWELVLLFGYLVWCQHCALRKQWLQDSTTQRNFVFCEWFGRHNTFDDLTLCSEKQ